jgi:CheY-like chemotaxis protein
MLHDGGYHVQSVLHGDEVLATLQQTRPRLIILDIALPEVDGWNLLAGIRGTPDIAAIPVLMYADQNGSPGVFLDACAHLVKPIPEEALLAVVGQWAPPPATVVVIDDDPDAREIMHMILADAGYSAILAPDGVAGLAAVHGATPDLVLLDLMMPQMDGFAVLEAIRAAGKHELPVVVVSALELEQSEWHWLRTRTQAHLAKSESAAPSLLAHVRRILGTTYVA